MTRAPKPRPSPRFARTQRAALTQAEAILWRELRNRRFGGVKFRRQFPIGPYVADFVCLEARLIVELDGAPHESASQRAKDATRDAWLRSQNFEVLRFSNDLLLGGAGEQVLAVIRATLQRDDGCRVSICS